MSRFSSIVPKYFQIEQLMRRRVSAMPSGAALPSEAELIKEYGVSRATIRVAVDALASDGLVRRVQGRGTFVSQSRLDIPVGYDSSVKDPSKNSGDVVHRLTSFRRSRAGRDDGAVFGIAIRDKVLRVERVTYKGEMSLGFGTLVVPDALVPDISRRDFEHGRFFNTLFEHGLKLARYRLVIESSSIPAILAATLDVRPGLPAISLTRTAFTSDGRAVAQVQIMTRGDVGRYILDAEFGEAKTSMSLALANDQT